MNNYRTTNFALLTCCVLIVTAIVVSYKTNHGVCAAKALWGRECILCGCTRDWFLFVNGNFNFHNPISPWIFTLLILELPWRVFAILKRNMRHWVIVADCTFHALVLISISVANVVRLLQP